MSVINDLNQAKGREFEASQRYMRAVHAYERSNDPAGLVRIGQEARYLTFARAEISKLEAILADANHPDWPEDDPDHPNLRRGQAGAI